MSKDDFNKQQEPKPQGFNQPQAKPVSKKAEAKKAEREQEPPKVEVADLTQPNPEEFKPKDPEAVVIAKSHPANPSTIATANVMRAQGLAEPEEDDAEVVDLASEKEAPKAAA